MEFPRHEFHTTTTFLTRTRLNEDYSCIIFTIQQIIWACRFWEDLKIFSKSETKVVHGGHISCRIKTIWVILIEDHTNIMCTKLQTILTSNGGNVFFPRSIRNNYIFIENMTYISSTKLTIYLNFLFQSGRVSMLQPIRTMKWTYM